MYKINKQKCTGRGVCMANCPGATELEAEGKAKVIDQDKLEKCGGENLCPFGAIEKIPEEVKRKQQTPLTSPLYSSPSSSFLKERESGKSRGFGRSRGIKKKRRRRD